MDEQFHRRLENNFLQASTASVVADTTWGIVSNDSLHMRVCLRPKPNLLRAWWQSSRLVNDVAFHGILECCSALYRNNKITLYNLHTYVWLIITFFF